MQYSLRIHQEVLLYVIQAFVLLTIHQYNLLGTTQYVLRKSTAKTNWLCDAAFPPTRLSRHVFVIVRKGFRMVKWDGSVGTTAGLTA
jgi:hypothetical protein